MPETRETEYERIRQVLERAVARICPVRFSDRRPDIVQAAILKILEIEKRGETTAGGEQTGSRRASYLWKVAYTTVVDEMRRVARRREVNLDSARDADPGLEVPPAPVRAEDRVDLGHALQDCLERMAEPRRLTVALHLDGFSAAESARSLGWNLVRIRNLVFRGLVDLRRCLEAKGIRP